MTYFSKATGKEQPAKTMSKYLKWRVSKSRALSPPRSLAAGSAGYALVTKVAASGVRLQEGHGRQSCLLPGEQRVSGSGKAVSGQILQSELTGLRGIGDTDC